LTGLDLPFNTKIINSLLSHSILNNQKQTIMMKKIILAVYLFVGISSLAQAQTSIADMVKDWERAKAYTKEYLDAMPDAGYALKPTPQMRSFADQMLHLTDANYGFAAAVTGDKSPVGFGESEKEADKSKANVTKAVMAGYDFVINSLQKMTPTQLTENVKLFGRFDMTKAAAISKLFEHQTHHRGQTTVYIRLAGATPPQEKLF
jgi:uncharacterized damage-inducible protein DinB